MTTPLLTFITVNDLPNGTAAITWRSDVEGRSVGFGVLDLGMVGGFSYGHELPDEDGNVTEGEFPTLLIYLRSGTALALKAANPDIFIEVVDRLTPKVGD